MRARDIKPGFYLNEQLAECSPWARLIFPGLWMIADRCGRLEYRPKKLKAELLPYDGEDVAALVEELAAQGLVVLYEHEGAKYLWIPTFSKHQKPHPNEKASVLPPCPYEEISHQGNTQDIPRSEASITLVHETPSSKGVKSGLLSSSLPSCILTPPLTPPPGDAEAGLAGVGGEASRSGREEKHSRVPCGKPAHAEEQNENAETRNSWPDIEFVQLLDAYPAAKRDEAPSWAAWRGLRKAKELPGIAVLLEAVSEWEDSRQWQKENGEYIPLLSNWLQRRRFRDHPPRAAPENSFPSEEELNAAAEKMRTLGVAS